MLAAFCVCRLRPEPNVGKMMRKNLGLAVALALSTALSACGGNEATPAQNITKTDVEKPVLKLGFIKLTDMASPTAHKRG